VAGFVELDRDFVRLQANQPYGAETVGLEFFRSRDLKWPDLLAAERVVVLAEAQSGKSEEFRQQVARLRSQNRFALFLTVERLAQNRLEDLLGLEDRQALDQWRRSDQPGWFFLDSIDEARVNQRDVEVALNQFVVALGATYPRARILLSCRGTVWTGEEDLALIERTLPPRFAAQPAEVEKPNPDEALLVKPDKRVEVREAKPVQRILLVALAKISRPQRLAFLTSEELVDVEAFESALFLRGLTAFAERPGDLKTLVGYWRRHGAFGDLTEMIEFAITERLVEQGDRRRSSIGISAETARSGAERLAAAMTLGQSMDLRMAWVDEPDGIDPHRVLSDWNPKDVDIFLQRGLFVPASYGRVRFYHRSAQEYLTACWFRRLTPDLAEIEMARIFLADPFGVPTVPPSLRAATGWLAQWNDPLRHAVMGRDPRLLMAEGDPGRLALGERSELLLTYALCHREGATSYRMIDHRALWMFAGPALVPAIREALAINKRPDFHFEMLLLIQQGKLADCRDLVLEVALDRSANVYHRIVATDILQTIGDKKGMKQVAADLLEDSKQLPARLASPMVRALYPDALKMSEVLRLIASSEPARPFEVEGFRAGDLAELHQAAPRDADRRALVKGLADLAFAPPLQDWPHLSSRHAELVKHLTPVARAAILASDIGGIDAPTIKLVRAAGRGRDDDPEEGPSLAEMVAARPALNAALFWDDLEEESAKSDKPITSVTQVGNGGVPLWRLSAADRPWLEAALQKSNAVRRRVALDALVRIARSEEDEGKAALERLAAMVSSAPDLAATVEDARTPREETPEEKRQRERWEGIELNRQAQEERVRGYWLKVRERVQTDPEALRDPAKLRKWANAAALLQLTQWLGKRADDGYNGAAQAWRLLEVPFGSSVAEAYRDGMKQLWRVTAPLRPAPGSEPGQRTVKYSIILSIAGLALEAAEDKDWLAQLSQSERLLAARHACLDDQGIPEWFGALLEMEPLATPLAIAEIRREWRCDTNYNPWLSAAKHQLPLVPTLRAALLRLIAAEPPSAARVADSAEMMPRLALDARERTQFARLVERRYLAAAAGPDRELALALLRLWFKLAPDKAAAEFLALLKSEMRKRKHSRARPLLRAFFDRHRGSVVDPAKLQPALLKEYLSIAYALWLPTKGRQAQDNDDNEQADSLSDPLNELLSALSHIPSEEAYLQMLALSELPGIQSRRDRLREIAHEMAEAGGERAPWTETEVRAFEADLLAPIRTGGDLLKLVLGLLDRIDWEFGKEDMSTRAVVETARDENAVQEWLGSTLQRMGGGRFRCQREPLVAGGNMPDINVIASSAPVEVAIEIKHDEKGWTRTALSHALADQLTERYLQPEARRHGVLVITNHRDAKFWRDAAQKKRLGFAEVINRLAREAAAIRRNSSGSVTVAVRGLDASPRRRRVPAMMDARRQHGSEQATQTE
jgi:hypothetical protein